MNKIKPIKEWNKNQVRYKFGVESGKKQYHYKYGGKIESIVVQISIPESLALTHLAKWKRVYTYYHFQYDEIREVIKWLSEKYGKEEVEKELGIKIKEDKRLHGGR